MSNYTKTCGSELIEQAMLWVNKMKKRNKMRNDIRLSLHDSLYMEIKENIYDLRKMEIKLHEDRFKRHMVVSAYALKFFWVI